MKLNTKDPFKLLSLDDVEIVDVFIDKVVVELNVVVDVIEEEVL